MQFSQTLIADSSGLGVSGTLFWLFLVAAIVWLLIWLLLKSDGSDGGVTSDSTQATEPETKSPPEPEAMPEPGPQPAKALPSQAFTIWTKPGSSPAPSKSEAGEESKDEAEDDAPESNSMPALDTATAEEAAAQFQADLDSGIARQDENLGILYGSAPDDADDLKEIKGVAKVLEGKLHDFGVYKFKQIAFWTDTAVAEFAQRLTFKDRIYRDDWIAQAKKFHEAKYGEKL